MSNTILDHWKMYFDGSLKLGRASAGVLLISLDGKQLKYVLQILWQATNNETEYEALIHGLRVAITLGIKRLLVYGDSTVVINQVNKDWDCTKDNMGAYCVENTKTQETFSRIRNSTCPARFEYCSRCPRQAQIRQGEGPTRRIHRRVISSLYQTNQRDNP